MLAARERAAAMRVYRLEGIEGIEGKGKPFEAIMVYRLEGLEGLNKIERTVEPYEACERH